jgi:hypothetical protein
MKHEAVATSVVVAALLGWHQQHFLAIDEPDIEIVRPSQF